MSESNQQLEPCRFCGKESKGHWDGPYVHVSGAPGTLQFYSIVCNGCCSTACYESREAAIAKWNSRVSAGGVVATTVDEAWARTAAEALKDNWLLSDATPQEIDQVAAIIAAHCPAARKVSATDSLEKDRDALRQVARMALQQFQFTYGQRARGWDAKFLMERLEAVIAESEGASPSWATVIEPASDAANEAANKIADYFNAPPSVVPGVEQIINRVIHTAATTSPAAPKEEAQPRSNRDPHPYQEHPHYPNYCQFAVGDEDYCKQEPDNAIHQPVNVSY